MKIKVWSKELSDKETSDIAYWERNMLALIYADGWYYDNGGGFEGWRRVLSLKDGKMTFHIPDDFDVGNLRQMVANWDGHTTHEKWARVAKYRNIEVES